MPPNHRSRSKRRSRCALTALGGVTGIVLLGAAAPRQAHAEELPVESRRLSVGIEGGAGVLESELTALDDLLLADGFEALPRVRMLVALDAVAEVWRPELDTSGGHVHLVMGLTLFDSGGQRQ